MIEYNEASPEVRAVYDDILATLGQAEREALGKILTKLIAAQGDDETAG